MNLKGMNYFMKKNAPYPFYEVKEIKNLKEMLESSCREFRDRTAFLVKKKSGEPYVEIKYSQVLSDVNALGTALIDMGLKGKNIAVIGENRYEWCITYLAVVNGTGSIVPLDKELPEAEIESLLTRSNTTAVVYSGKRKDEIESIKSKNSTPIKHYISMDNDSTAEITLNKLLEKGRKLLKKKDKRFTNAKIDNEAANIILFTSGTTDKSKAVLLSHKNIVVDMMAACANVLILPEDRFFSILPVHHTYECTTGFLIPLYRGSSIAICEGLRYILPNMQEAHPTLILGVPAIFENMYAKLWATINKKGLAKKLKAIIKVSNALLKVGIDIRKIVFKSIHENFGGKLRLCIVGAAAVNPEVSAGFRELGIEFIQGYGLTECAPLIAVNRDHYYNDAAAGVRVKGVELKIDNPNDEGIGEICAKGDNVMIGYYNDEEATKKVLKDGWLHTGDLGYFDDKGFLFITGRLKSVLITKNGKNVYPEEIEPLLNKSDIIKESMVYQKDNKEKDDTIISAIIVPDYETIKEKFGKLSDEELKEKLWQEVKAVNEQLVTYKHIKEITVREQEFEKTTTLKIKRYLVK